MNADMLADDELHTGKTNPIVRQHSRCERKLGVPEIDHDSCAGVLQISGDDSRNLERQRAGVNSADVPFRAADGRK